MGQFLFSEHRIQLAEFDLLAGADPAPELIAPLKQSRVSRVLLLVKYILDGSPDLREAARLLCEAHDADAMAVNDVLISPWVARWAAVCAGDLAQLRAQSLHRAHGR